MGKKKSAKKNSKSKSKAKSQSKTAKSRKVKADDNAPSKKWKFGGVVVKTIAGAALFQSYAMGKSY